MTKEDRITTARELLQHARAREARTRDILAAAQKAGDASEEAFCNLLIANNQRFIKRIEADLKKLES